MSHRRITAELRPTATLLNGLSKGLPNKGDFFVMPPPSYRSVASIIAIAVLVSAAVLPTSAFAADEYVHHIDQYGLIGDDCTDAHPCITAQLRAAQAARQQQQTPQRDRPQPRPPLMPPKPT